MSFSRSVLESHVLAVAITQLVEPVEQRLHPRGVLPGSEGEIADPIHLPRLLCLDGERGRREAQRENTEPDQPHGHLGWGWLAGSLADVAHLATTATHKAWSCGAWVVRVGPSSRLSNI